MAPCMIFLALGVQLAPVAGHRIQRDLDELGDAAHLSADGNASIKLTFAKPEITTIQNWDFIRSGKDGNWGHKSVRRVNEDADVGVGQFCLTTSPKEARYYTSSFCYWLPDRAPAGTNNILHNQNFGLTWDGGTADTMCDVNPKLEGKCVRCVACHDNGRTKRNGKVTVGSGKATEVPLPSDCAKESKIHLECTAEFNRLNPSLVAENTRCHGVKTRYTNAVNTLNGFQSQISFHTARIERNNQELHMAKQRLSREQDLLRDHRRNWRFAQFRQQSACGCFVHNIDDHCHSNCNIDDNACHSRCQNARYNADRQRKNIRQTHANMNSYNAQIFRLDSQITNSMHVAAQARQELPGAQARKDSMEAEWSPQSNKCEATFVEHDGKYSAHLIKCIPTWYDRSCEKACVQLSVEQGCGVLEGGVRDDALGRGGPHATCKPPAPSWILPSNQCERIEVTQKEARLQQVLKAGFLRIKESGLFKKIWLVLESGTAARSPTLRIFGDIHGAEWINKFVILWDAVEVSHLVRRGKYDQCILIKHHYEGREKKYNKKGEEILFCADPEETSGLSEVETAQQWLEALKPLVGDGHKGGQ